MSRRALAGSPVSYDGRRFRSVANTPNGEVGGDTVFEYAQHGLTVTGTYAGGSIATGHLVATVDTTGCLDMRYHHVNVDGGLRAGRCRSTPEFLADGRIRLHERWRWFTGDRSPGTSVIEEVVQ